MAYEELKSRQSVMWGTGPYQRVTETISEIHELVIEEHVSTLSIESGEAYWDLFSSSYGPTKTLADSLGDRRDDFARAWIDFFESEYRSGDEIVHTREYLFVRGRRR